MRVTSVKKSRQARECGKCGDKIAVGDGYVWWKFRFGGKRVRCLKAECAPRPSDLTSSDKLSRLYAIQENLSDEIAEWRKNDPTDTEDLKTALESAGSEAREVADEYRESAQNIEDGFGHETSMSEEINEKAESVDSWADELEQVDLDESCERDDDAPNDVLSDWQDEQAQKIEDASVALEL